jgi:hypothetical protein
MFATGKASQAELGGELLVEMFCSSELDQLGVTRA